MTDGESQADEIYALQSIFTDEEFKNTCEEGVNRGLLLASVNIPENFTVVMKDTNGSHEKDLTLTVQYLPPIELAFTLPPDYPSQAPPWYTISCPWLSRDMLTKLCKELDRIWEENKGSEVLFTWSQFLKEESLPHLGITDTFEVLCKKLENKHVSNLQELNSEKNMNVVQVLQNEKPPLADDNYNVNFHGSTSNITEEVKADNNSTSFVNSVKTKTQVGTITKGNDSSTNAFDSENVQTLKTVKSNKSSLDSVDNETQTSKHSNNTDSKFTSKNVNENFSHSRNNSFNPKELNTPAPNVLLDKISSSNQYRYKTGYFYSKSNPRYRRKRYTNNYETEHNNENYNDDVTKKSVVNFSHLEEQKISNREKKHNEKRMEAGHSRENCNMRNDDTTNIEKKFSHIEEQKRNDKKYNEKRNFSVGIRSENYNAQNDTKKNVSHLEKQQINGKKRYQKRNFGAGSSSETCNVQSYYTKNIEENDSYLEGRKRNDRGKDYYESKTPGGGNNNQNYNVQTDCTKNIENDYFEEHKRNEKGNFRNKCYVKRNSGASYSGKNYCAENGDTINIVNNDSNLVEQRRNERYRGNIENKQYNKRNTNYFERKNDYRINRNTNNCRQKPPGERKLSDSSFENNSLETKNLNCGDSSKNNDSNNVEDKRFFKKNRKYRNQRKYDYDCNFSDSFSSKTHNRTFKNDESKCVNENMDEVLNIGSLVSNLNVSQTNDEACENNSKLIEEKVDCQGEDHVGDSQDSYSNLFLLLKNYNKDRLTVDFLKSVYTCAICFTEKMGVKCTKFQPCEHVFCRECCKGYFEVRIKEGSVNGILCPDVECSSEAMVCQIKDIVSDELFARYDSLLLTTTLDTMTDIIYCPRPACRYPTSKEEGSNMAQCPLCDYVFCILCNMVYHGIEPCRFKGVDKYKIYQEYQHAEPEKKLLLEQKYGKKRLEALIETTMSETWIVDNSKKCPNCNAAIEKSEGCNKMVCSKCGQFFCYLCGMRLNATTPYKHYNDPKSSCYFLLFEGGRNAEAAWDPWDGPGNNLEDVDI